MAILFACSVFRPTAGSPGPLERDFEAYYAAGVTSNAGADPYSRAIWSAEARIPGVFATRDEVLPFVGPAAMLPVYKLLGRFPYRVALVLWTTLLICALVAVPLCALRFSRTPRDPLGFAAVFVFTITAAPTIGDLALGQAALLSAAGIAVALLAYRARAGGAAFCATLLCAVQPNLALALLGRVRTRWDAGIAVAAAGAFTALTLAAGGGIGGLGAYLHRLGAHAAAERFITIQHTPAAIAFAFGCTPPAAAAVGYAIAVATLIAVVAVIRYERLDPTTAGLICCAAMPLATPFFHEQDFVLEILPLLILALRARGRTRGLAAIAAVLILVDWFGFAQRPAAQGQIICLGVAVAAAFIAVPRAPFRRWECAGVAALVVLAASVIPLGRAHPAPTWPDALPTTYRASAVDVSAVWHDEQRAGGLTAADPVWGALRTIPLAGCALLAVALAGDARDRRRRRRAAPVNRTTGPPLRAALPV